MNILSADRISKAFTERWLFKEISFGVSKGDKLALVGSNGTGKSTLLKVIAGLISPDTGERSFANGITFGYLPQEPDLDEELSIRQTIFADDNPMVQLVSQYEAAIMDENYPADKMQYLLEQMEDKNAWDFEKSAHQILGKLGIHHLEALNKTLSGGQRKRVALAQLLMRQPDLLIMDEPTNHLDLEAIEWLENLLTAHQVSLIMVTHDRYFLDNVATQILELDRGKLYIHNGNYAYFLEKKSQREANLLTEVTKARNLMVKELEWMRRMPKARGTKSKSRIEAFYDLKDKASQQTDQKELEISVRSSRLGNKIIEIDHLHVQFDQTVLIKDFSYIFKKNDRIGIVGRNGIGKSTLLDALTQSMVTEEGQVIHGPTLKLGYYTQHTNNLNNDNRIIDEVKEIAEFVTLGNGEQVPVSKLLDMFLFPPAVQYTPIHKLSGGERRRLQLLKVLVASPNFLILDEPTNDLDIDTLNVLEDFLEGFNGCLVLVSHDRYFMDHLVEHLFVFEGNGEINEYYGNYTDYRAAADEREKMPEAKVAFKNETAAVTNAPVVKRKLSYKEQLEFNGLEAEIANLESNKKTMEEKMNAGNIGHEELMKLAQSIELIQRDIEVKTEKWITYSELLS
ncbi:MAG: ABC-F family ATP-binding cassette domain-containing protein [Bacteroidota bacterium]